MAKTEEEKKQLSFLLESIMIGLETFYSFVFKHDDLVQKQALPLIEENLHVKINCYIPYFNFYITFSKKGMLFNLTPSQEPVNTEISSTIFGYVQALVLGNKKSIYGIKIYTDNPTQKEQIRDLITSLSLPHLSSDWKKWLWTPSPKQDSIASPLRTSNLLEKIDQQRSKINHLYVENKQLKNRIRHLKSSQRQINIMFFLVTLCLIIALIYKYVT